MSGAGKGFLVRILLASVYDLAARDATRFGRVLAGLEYPRATPKNSIVFWTTWDTPGSKGSGIPRRHFSWGKCYAVHDSRAMKLRIIPLSLPSRSSQSLLRASGSFRRVPGTCPSCCCRRLESRPCLRGGYRSDRRLDRSRRPSARSRESS